MTWNTSQGFRELTAKERELFRLVIDDVLGEIHDAGRCELYSVDELHPSLATVPFDGLSTPQKCATLLEVCQALFEKTDEIPELTAISECCVLGFCLVGDPPMIHHTVPHGSAT